MNKFLILIFCAIISKISAETFVFYIPPNELLRLQDLAAKCNVEADTPKDAMLMILHNEFPDNDAFKKFSHCWLTSSGFVENNAYVIDKCIQKLADQKQANAFTKELEKCNEDVAGSVKDNEGKSFELIKCFNKLSSKITF